MQKLASSFMEAINKNAPILNSALLASVIGGGAGALLTSKPDEDEDPAEVRKRRLKNALIGAVGAGGATALLMKGQESLTTAVPVNDTQDPGSEATAALKSPIGVGIGGVTGAAMGYMHRNKTLNSRADDILNMAGINLKTDRNSRHALQDIFDRFDPNAAMGKQTPLVQKLLAGVVDDSFTTSAHVPARGPAVPTKTWNGLAVNPTAAATVRQLHAAGVNPDKLKDLMRSFSVNGATLQPIQGKGRIGKLLGAAGVAARTMLPTALGGVGGAAATYYTPNVVEKLVEKAMTADEG